MSRRLFDAHFHIISPDFPLIENQGFLPDPFTVSDYMEQASPLGVDAGAVVSGSFQAFDQSYLLDALGRLGPRFVGVTQLPFVATDTEILWLDKHNIRAVRFNLVRLGITDVDRLADFARRVHELAGWHVELYADTGKIDSLMEMIESLPAVSIDHLGLSARGLSLFKRLVKKGVHVKASGFGRLDFPVAEALAELYRANPDALMFGSDLPSTRARRPFDPADIELIESTLGAEGAEKVLRTNAERFYRLD
ncbi:MAG: amidohydrolase family protein [Gammaproteobacteria bacterium]|nr:amidohydrolase family protein [Gammaproteobacteria bacterium]